MAQVSSFQELAMHGLKDIYSAEQQALAAYPEMIQAATSDDLKAAFTEHMEQTRGQIGRLEQIFQKMNETPGGVECLAAKGLIAEAKEHIQEIESGPLLDAALIGAAQKVEHYEIASYGTARTFAEQMGDDIAAQLLEATLEEEELTDERLSDLAIATVNPDAADE